MNRIEILQNAVMRASELREPKSGTEARKWKLTHKWLVNPKLQCPYCKEWVESGRVWVIDEGRRYVHRVWEIDGTKVSPNRCHPHVGEGGKICMGSTQSGALAITMGLTPGETYGDGRQLYLWLPQVLGHQCERMERGEWVNSQGRECTDYQAREHFGGESEFDEHEGERCCDSCDDWHNEDCGSYCDVTDVWYCDDCWGDGHEICDDCSETIHTHSRFVSEFSATDAHGDRVTLCESCYSDGYFYCEKCSEDLPNEKHHEDGVCEECWAEGHAECEGCEEEFEKEKLILSDGRSLCEVCLVNEEEVSDGE